MMVGFYNGVSGIKSQSFGIDVIANNITNINNVGFKASTPEIKSTFYQTLVSNLNSPVNSQVGLGASRLATSLDMRQGSFMNTDSKFDMAIEGDGFFGIARGEELYFTRNGSFNRDRNGDLVDNEGRYVQGTMAALSPVTLSPKAAEKIGQGFNGEAFSVETGVSLNLDPIENQGKITLPQTLFIPSVATTEVSFKGYLNSELLKDTVLVNLNVPELAEEDLNLENDEIAQFLLPDPNDPDKASFSVMGDLNLAEPKLDFNENQEVLVKISDGANEIEIPTTINENGIFSVINLDVSGLDFNAGLTVSASSHTNQLNKEAKTLNYKGDLKETPEVLSLNENQEVIVEIKDGDGSIIEARTTADENGVFRLKDQSVRGLNLDTELQISAKAYVNQEVPNEFANSTDIFNADGTKSVIKINYTKQIPQNGDGTVWNTTATLTNANGEVEETAMGQLVYNDKGALIENSLTNIGGVTLSFGSFYEEGVANSGFDGMVSNANKSQITDVKKDGFAEGLLKDYEMNDNGEILAVFDNGMQGAVAKLALYHFQNDQGLHKIGENAYAASANSGAPIFFLNENGDAIYGAKIKNQMLEMSNVDLGSALTELIIMQKAYDASAKSITTSDEMVKNAINMKR